MTMEICTQFKKKIMSKIKKKKKINTFFFTFISFKEFFYLKKFANKVKMWANSDALLDNAKS